MPRAFVVNETRKRLAQGARPSKMFRQALHQVVRSGLFWDRLSPSSRQRLWRLAHCVMPRGITDYFNLPREVARPIEADYSVEVPFGYTAPKPAVDLGLAVVCHLYHDDLASEFVHYLSNIPIPFDTFISTDTLAKKANIERQLLGRRAGRVEVRLAQNRGRDIAPKLITFRDLYEQYEFVLHLHSKSSRHAGELVHWRGFLLESLLGSEEVVESIFAAFVRYPDLGLVSAQHFEPIRHAINWTANFAHARALAARMGITLSPNRVLDFPGGSMFWARSAALRPLLDLELSFEDFDPEEQQVDGTLAHAIERLFFFACERAGFKWIKVAQRDLFLHTPAIVPIESAEALDRFMTDHTLKLTGPDVPRPRRVPLPVVSGCAPGLLSRRQVRRF